MQKIEKIAQVVKCKCESIVAACVMPYCYEDTEWQRNIRKWSQKGYTIHLLGCDEFCISKCKCNENELF